MDTWYWALEYVRVFFAYVMILFVWPSVVFRDYLRGRSRTVRFAFCVTGADQKDLPPVSGNLRHPAFAASPAQQSKRRDRACTCTIQAEHTGTALRLSDAWCGRVLWHGVFFLRGIP